MKIKFALGPYGYEVVLGNITEQIYNKYAEDNQALVDDVSGFNEDSEIILKTVQERDIDKVFFNKQFGQDEQKRDKEVINILEGSGIKAESFNDQIVYEAGSIRTGQDNPYSVFTPFKRKWVENFDMEFLDIEHKYTPMNQGIFSSNISSFNFDFKIEHKVDMSIWPAGEQAALDRLKNFLENKASNYSKDRNDPIIDGTSRMSPYLALGIISSKRCILEGLKLKAVFCLDHFCVPALL